MYEREVRQLLRKPWLVVAPLDKGRHRVRMICPQRAWQEQYQAADQYCEWGPMMATPEATNIQKAWRDRAVTLQQAQLNGNWPEVPMHWKPAQARTAAKSKAPMTKFRLIVATNHAPTSEMSRTSAAAAEFMVDLMTADTDMGIRTVDSIADATRKLQEMTEHLRRAAMEGRPCWTARKYDFRAFFQKEQRDQVDRSLLWLLELCLLLLCSC